MNEPFRTRLRRDLFAGLAFFLPLALLAVVLYGLALVGFRGLWWFDGVLGTLGVRGPVATTLAVAGAVVAVPLVLVAAGALLRHRYGEQAAGAVDALVERVPGVGPVYAELGRSREVFAGEGKAFREVVSLEFADGVDVLAFVVGRETGADWTGEGRVTVYVPMAPNPTVGGHLLAVRADRVTPTDLTVRSALAVLVTMGTSDPEAEDPPVTTLYRGMGVVDERGADEPTGSR